MSQSFKFVPRDMMSTPLHETADYAVHVGRMLAEGELKGLDGYLIVNKRTGIVEGELNVEFAALRAIRDLQTQLESALESKDVDDSEEMTFAEFLEQQALQQDGE